MSNGFNSTKPAGSGERGTGYSYRGSVENLAEGNPGKGQGQRTLSERARAAAIEALGGDEPLEWIDEDTPTGVVHLKAKANRKKLESLCGEDS